MITFGGADIAILQNVNAESLSVDNFLSDDSYELYFPKPTGEYSLGTAISGGESTDQFWIAVTETLEANTITNFTIDEDIITIDEDIIRIAGLEIGFEDVEINQQEDNALIHFNGLDFAILPVINTNGLTIDTSSVI